MDSIKLLVISDSVKSKLWDFFQLEESLVSELEYCESRIKIIGAPNTSLEIAQLTVYKKHIKNIQLLLRKLHLNEQIYPGM